MQENPIENSQIEESTTVEDGVLDQTLRPSRFDEYIGQQNIKDNLTIFLEAAKQRKSPSWTPSLWTSRTR